jgi:hypothetical protein
MTDQTSHQIATGMPRVRPGETTRFAVGDHVGYLTSGRTRQGAIGELTLRIADDHHIVVFMDNSSATIAGQPAAAGVPPQRLRTRRIPA